ncbi:ATP-binding cassette domain-containing protein [Photobacterium aphoticum]|uniref:ABC transporter ATP-binding protein n=1 Tax=Photobacterium aphoticum TaxID=754436 RepID=A0A090QL76_9GAMM|nr:energy-coupling factor ABC transporter ATP-binding protein [Photobacterium aphoticum]KLV00545.1 ABC transporter ATP-binding protein [Photobacterium aphoticum]PSU59903.1 ABC transporter ATP-binding protein [Photobacterium aphoticum]GAL03676.1 ABC-type tungstate transport system ATP-binding protein [Photobacterium aphoticum]GHA41428.1 ABC transporter ATP-binding protein [Photobacterium aphoticum]
MTQLSIQAHDLSVRFKDRLLFHVPQLILGPQDAVYLTGDNGVGKTTLLKVLSGLQKPTTGTINLAKHSFLRRLFCAQSNSGVVYMHQTPYMFDGSILDNVCYGLKFSVGNRRHRRTEAINALRMVGLETLADEHISVLSGGERQRVAMARAWVLKPGVLLMDESSASLDPESIERLVVLCKDLIERGTSLVITSHQKNALTDLCRRQWTISDSKLIERADLQLVDEDKNTYAYA